MRKIIVSLFLCLGAMVVEVQATKKKIPPKLPSKKGRRKLYRHPPKNPRRRAKSLPMKPTPSPLVKNVKQLVKSLEQTRNTVQQLKTTLRGVARELRPKVSAEEAKLVYVYNQITHLYKGLEDRDAAIATGIINKKETPERKIAQALYYFIENEDPTTLPLKNEILELEELLEEIIRENVIQNMSIKLDKTSFMPQKKFIEKTTIWHKQLIKNITKQFTTLNEQIQQSTNEQLIKFTFSSITYDYMPDEIFPLLLAEWYRRAQPSATQKLELEKRYIIFLISTLKKAQETKDRFLTEPLQKSYIQNIILKHFTKETAESIQKNLPVVLQSLTTQLEQSIEIEEEKEKKKGEKPEIILPYIRGLKPKPSKPSPLVQGVKALVTSLEQTRNKTEELKTVLEKVHEALEEPQIPPAPLVPIFKFKKPKPKKKIVPAKPKVAPLTLLEEIKKAKADPVQSLKKEISDLITTAEDMLKPGFTTTRTEKKQVLISDVKKEVKELKQQLEKIKITKGNVAKMKKDVIPSLRAKLYNIKEWGKPAGVKTQEQIIKEVLKEALIERRKQMRRKQITDLSKISQRFAEQETIQDLLKLIRGEILLKEIRKNIESIKIDIKTITPSFEKAQKYIPLIKDALEFCEDLLSEIDDRKKTDDETDENKQKLENLNVGDLKKEIEPLLKTLKKIPPPLPSKEKQSKLPQ